jgi:hypothetical protein
VAGKTMGVSLRLLYLIFDRLLNWLLPLGRTSSAKNIELLVLRHVRGSKSRPELLTCGDPHPLETGHDHGVSLRFLYLIFDLLLSWLVLLSRESGHRAARPSP